MLASKLIQLIEHHWDEIAHRVIRQIRREAALLELGKLPESDLRERTRDILLHLGTWLVSREDDVAIRYEQLGRKRFEEGVPLHEMVYALQIIKDKAIEYVRDQGFYQTSVDLYAEEELEHGVNRIFDRLVYYVVRGYERAMREHFHVAA